MSIRVLICENDGEFRRLLRHHVTTAWPEATITEYDPSTSGPFGDTVSAAQWDVALVGHQQNDRIGLQWLTALLKLHESPPAIYLATAGDEFLAVKAIKAGAHNYIPKRKLTHPLLIEAMREAQHSRGKLVDTGRIFRSTPGSSQSGVEGIKGHRLLRTISSGGASSVYLTENDSAAERIVLKVLKQVPDEIDGEHVFDRFIQEYELIAGIQHPNIVRIFDLGIADDHAFIAMEYFSAGDLKSRIQSGLKPGRILEYLRQITDALGVIHEVEVLHRDLKPGNIMFREDGSLGLIDFGLAKEMRLKAAITGTGQIFGTPYYMSPEQGHAGKVDQRSDIYSLGVIFYEMLTGMKPFRGSSPMGVIYKHSHAARPSLPHRLGEYQPLLEQMLAVAPQDRFQSAGELRTALN